MNLNDKLYEFNALCQDYNYRNIDNMKPYLSKIYIEDNSIGFICEVCVELCDYFSGEVYESFATCNGGQINEKKFINKFKNLDLEDKNSVLSFINCLETFVDWKKVENDIKISQRVLENGNYSEFMLEEGIMLDDEISL